MRAADAAARRRATDKSSRTSRFRSFTGGNHGPRALTPTAIRSTRPGARAEGAARRPSDVGRASADERPRRVPRAAAATRTLPPSGAAADDSQVNYQDPSVVETPLPQPLPTYYPNVARDVAGAADRREPRRDDRGRRDGARRGDAHTRHRHGSQKRWPAGQRRVGRTRVIVGSEASVDSTAAAAPGFVRVVRSD